MSNFKVGDVCVILVGDECGKECTVEIPHYVAPYDQDFSVAVSIPGVPSGHPTGFWRFRPNELRLRRPPSWDKWLYDTSGLDKPVRTEREREHV